MKEESRLADNILLFCRTLRAAGVPVSVADVIDSLRAAAIVGIRRRDDLQAALGATLISDAAHLPLFRQAFAVWFRNPRLLDRVLGMVLPASAAQPESRPPAPASRRLAEALAAHGDTEASTDADDDTPAAGSFSALEVLRDKDFEQMSAAELAHAERLISAELAPLEKLPSRRFRADARGARIDLRRSIQQMMRRDGQMLTLARKRRRERTPPVVVICDISGSMSRYSRLALLFSHALGKLAPTVHCFVFGTRLSNVSRHLRSEDSDEALAGIAADVRDWDGGTRIAACLEDFNRHWGRRVLTQGASVLLLSDGLERDTEADLEFQIARLHRSCRQLIWLNPMLRYDKFQPRAYGVRTMLPHVDRFLPAHNLASLEQLATLLGAPSSRALVP